VRIAGPFRYTLEEVGSCSGVTTCVVLLRMRIEGCIACGRELGKDECLADMEELYSSIDGKTRR